MSKDLNPSEEQNSAEETSNQEENTAQENADLQEDVNTDANDMVEEEVEESKKETSEDVFGDDSEEVSLEISEEEAADEVSEEATSTEEVEKDVFGSEDESEEEENVEVENTEVVAPVPEAAPEEKKKVEDHKKWYSLRVISGKERKIKERIELEISRSKWGDYVTQILVPSEKVYKIRNGKKVILERNILPGYILVEADPDNFTGEMVQAIANVPNVIHFLGRNNPIPMQASEANRMLGKVDESQSLSEAMIEPYIVGETVKIIDGPFNEFVGDIQEVNEEKKKMKVIVKIFGRGTEVELNFMQVEKQQ